MTGLCFFCFVSFLSNLIFFRSTCTLVTYHSFECEEAFVDNGSPWLPSKRCDSVSCHTRPSADRPCNSMEYTKYNNTSYERLKRIWFGWDHCWMQLCIQGHRVFLFFRIKSTWPHAVSHYIGQCTISLGQEFWLIQIEKCTKTQCNRNEFPKAD